MQHSKKYSQIFLISIATLFASLFSSAQTSYTDYRSDPDKIILNETFDNTKSGIPLSEYCKIDNGMLVISQGFKIKPSTTFQLNQNKDFEIEQLIYATNKKFVIVFDQIRWYILNKEFDLDAGGINQHVYSNKPISPILNLNKLHKFTIRKIGENFYFFIDEENVGECKSDFLKVLQKEFMIEYRWPQTIDYLKVSYLTKNEGGEGNKEIPEKTDKTTPDKTTSKTKGPEPVKQEVKQEIKQGGKYYGLIIGVSEYDEPRLKLDEPIKDAKKIKDVLISRYSFTDSTTFLVVNPTRQKILVELFHLRKIVGSNDNLLIFYAGHGYWDEQARQGYWWPKDAGTDDPSNWLSNSDLREQIRSIKSAHTLLISDACFSGGIFKTRGANDIMNATKDIQLLYRMPSRRAMTSGTMTEVPDKSIFLDYLTKRLKENQSKFLSAQQLFDSFRSAVINNSSVVPQDGVIAETGDEGGDFIFILKDN